MKTKRKKGLNWTVYDLKRIQQYSAENINIKYSYININMK